MPAILVAQEVRWKRSTVTFERLAVLEQLPASLGQAVALESPRRKS